MTRNLNHEEAAIELDEFAARIEDLSKDLDRFTVKLQPDWRAKWDAIDALEHIDKGLAGKLKTLANEIYKQGEAAADLLENSAREELIAKLRERRL